MDIFMIVIAVICAYVFFVLASYLLMRLLFPRIEIDDSEVRPLKARNVNRFSPSRADKKQKDLAY